MKVSTRDTTKRKRPIGKGTPIMVRLQPADLTSLDGWIADNGGDLSRPEAIRRIVRKVVEDRVADDLAAIQAYDRARASLAAGDDELIPAEYANRLLDGESPLRVYREFRGYTQQQLGNKAGVNRVQIADIEARRKTGSIDTVAKLANALSVTVDDLM